MRGNGRWTTETEHNYPSPSPSAFSALVGPACLINANNPSLLGVIVGEHSPKIGIVTNYSQTFINQERGYKYLFVLTTWQTKPDQGWCSQEHELTPMLWKPSPKVQLLKPWVLQVTHSSHPAHSGRPGYKTELSLWLRGYIGCVIAQISSFCFGRFLNKRMLLLYLAVGPSSVQALCGEILSVRLVEFFPTCFLTAVLK